MDPSLSEPNLLGLRHVRIPRYKYGFGFTLRHFIVYPPNIYENNELHVGVNRNQYVDSSNLFYEKVTEPVDTIFVKSVREDGPAHPAGLRVGDRIVSVNGDRIVGRSYDQVVHLIQHSNNFVDLEVSPKQYDTLQLFYEDKAYRPETNQRPIQNPNPHPPIPPPRRYFGGGYPYSYATLPYESKSKMNSTSTSQQQSQSNNLFSHLPRPPPYKSTNTNNWSHINPTQQNIPTIQQHQTYYPFQTKEFSQDNKDWGFNKLIPSPQNSQSSSNRYGSMECLSQQNPIGGSNWKNSPGYRFSISTGPSDTELYRNNLIGVGVPGGFFQPSSPHKSSDMIVTMSGGINEIPSDVDVDGVSGSDRGYELKMADRIRKSTEQKEEFLRRPNQPLLQWTPIQSSSIGGPTPFPKEFYAQPQKFQKVPWPPTPPQSQPQPVEASDDSITVSMRGPQNLRTNYGGSLDETSGRKLNTISLQQNFSKSIQGVELPESQLQQQESTNDLIPGRNRVTVVGSGKVHCDPPKGWKHPHPTISLIHETESHVQNIDTDVILRKRENDPESEAERLVRRVSYLKATSSPIDMETKTSSPTTPTKSPSSEFRTFGPFPSPDSTEVLREGQVHFKVRGTGDTKKNFGYSRSWRFGWAQVRGSGFLYLSKDKLGKEEIIGSEENILICIGVKEGVQIELAEDYTKRKNVLRIRGGGGGGGEGIEILIQGEDSIETGKWIGTLQQQQQQDNNNINNIGSIRDNVSSPRSLLRTFLNSPNISSSTQSSSSLQQQQQQSIYLAPPSTTNPPNFSSATSPKSKTWKGRVAKQWKKIHASSSSPLNSQSSIPESGGTFGVLLEECPLSDNCLVPKILEYCIEVVERKGLGVVGIYRIPGNNAAVSALTESLNKGNDINPESDIRWGDVHVISSLLKSFLRKLPDPILTSNLYPGFIKAAADPDSRQAVYKLKGLIMDLPDINYETLKLLTNHLKKVAENSEKNRMEPRNLAIVFGPTLVRTADANIDSLVNDMQHQCKIVELLINNADDIFKEKEYSPIPPEDPSPRLSSTQSQPQPQPSSSSQSQHQHHHQPNIFTKNSSSSPPKIENDIKSSLIKAALRKKQGVPHNTYGLPPPPPPFPPPPLERDRSVDESGLIRSYAGLGEETEERVRQFEMETRAHLYRDTRSPNPNTIPSASEADKLKYEKNRLEAQWRKAKDDLENDDFYDEIADNPNKIGDNRIGLNIIGGCSSSSLSSNGSLSIIPPFGGSGSSSWRLGPIPFKSTYSTQNLPPKPPLLKKLTPPHSISIESKVESGGGLNYDSRLFGSLDSLQNLGNGSKENISSDGSDLVSSLSRTFDYKLEGLRGSRVGVVNGGKKIDERLWDKGIILGKRRNSLQENRKKFSNEYQYEENGIKSINNGFVEEGGDVSCNGESPNLTTETTRSVDDNKSTRLRNKKIKDVQRRHSLSGTVDILRLVLGSSIDSNKKQNRNSDSTIQSSDPLPLPTSLQTTNILESHV